MVFFKTKSTLCSYSLMSVKPEQVLLATKNKQYFQGLKYDTIGGQVPDLFFFILDS